MQTNQLEDLYFLGMTFTGLCLLAVGIWALDRAVFWATGWSPAEALDRWFMGQGNRRR